MGREEYEEMLALRTRLTVALLAVAQMQRKGADPDAVARLTHYALDALLSAREELERVDTLIARLERGARRGHDPFLAPFPQHLEDRHDDS